MEYLWLAMVVGSAGWFGYLKGKGTERKWLQIEATKEPQPVCGCEHHYSKHNPDGTCAFRWSEQVLVERGQPRTMKSGYDGNHHKIVYDHEKWETVNYACSCTRYTGPEPLPRYVS